MRRKLEEGASEMVARARDWFTSEQGQRDLQEIFKLTENAKQEFAEASQIELDSLTKPVTV